MRPPELHLLCGLPYSGKSTVARALLERRPEAFVFAVDPILHERAEAEGLDYHEAWQTHFKDAETLMRARLAEAIEQRRDVIWDQLNLTARTRAKGLRRFPESYRRECYYVICGDAEELARRIQARSEQKIAPHVFEGMKKTVEAPDIAEGYDAIELIDTAG